MRKYRKKCLTCFRPFYQIGKKPGERAGREQCDACVRAGVKMLKPIAEVVAALPESRLIGVDDRSSILDANGRSVSSREYMVRLMKRGV